MLQKQLDDELRALELDNIGPSEDHVNTLRHEEPTVHDLPPDIAVATRDSYDSSTLLKPMNKNSVICPLDLSNREDHENEKERALEQAQLEEREQMVITEILQH